MIYEVDHLSCIRVQTTPHSPSCWRDPPMIYCVVERRGLRVLTSGLLPQNISLCFGSSDEKSKDGGVVCPTSSFMVAPQRRVQREQQVLPRRSELLKDAYKYTSTLCASS